MGHADKFVKGQNNVICDYCGFKFKSNELKKTWDGFYACRKDWSQRNAQDFVRGVEDDQSPAYSRPEGDDTFLASNDVQPGDL